MTWTQNVPWPDRPTPSQIYHSTGLVAHVAIPRSDVNTVVADAVQLLGDVFNLEPTQPVLACSWTSSFRRRQLKNLNAAALDKICDGGRLQSVSTIPDWNSARANFDLDLYHASEERVGDYGHEVIVITSKFVGSPDAAAARSHDYAVIADRLLEIGEMLAMYVDLGETFGWQEGNTFPVISGYWTADDLVTKIPGYGWLTYIGERLLPNTSDPNATELIDNAGKKVTRIQLAEDPADDETIRANMPAMRAELLPVIANWMVSDGARDEIRTYEGLTVPRALGFSTIRVVAGDPPPVLSPASLENLGISIDPALLGPRDVEWEVRLIAEKYVPAVEMLIRGACGAVETALRDGWIPEGTFVWTEPDVDGDVIRWTTSVQDTAGQLSALCASACISVAAVTPPSSESRVVAQMVAKPVES